MYISPENSCLSAPVSVFRSTRLAHGGVCLRSLRAAASPRRVLFSLAPPRLQERHHRRCCAAAAGRHVADVVDIVVTAAAGVTAPVAGRTTAGKAAASATRRRRRRSRRRKKKKRSRKRKAQPLVARLSRPRKRPSHCSVNVKKKGSTRNTKKISTEP